MLFFLIGCGAVTEIPVNNVTKIEYRDTTIFIRDTVTLTIPTEVIKEVVPQDTISILSTSVAVSEARVEKGRLHHKLEQKGAIKAPIDTSVNIQYIDRYIYKEVPIRVEVEKRFIPQWCWWSLMFNVITLMFFVLKIYFKFKNGLV